ncbi:MAG: F0F1 ATP synthase subunit B [Burkholderiales bacterium]
MDINLTMIGQAIAFAIFVWFTAKFVWPPLLRAIEDRQKAIADGLAAAEKGKLELAQADKKTIEVLGEARGRANEIISSAEKRAAQMVEEAKVAAKSEGDRIVAGAKSEVEQEVFRAKATLREQVASLAVAGAEKILRREVNSQAHADLLTQLKQEL